MRRTLLLLVLGVAAYLLAGTPPPVRALDYSYARIVRLSLVEGSVEVARPGQAGEQKALVNLPLEQGYSLATGADGRAEVEFESRDVADLAGNSHLTLTELALADGARITRLALASGTASFSAEPAHNDTFTVETPDLTVKPVKKSAFRLDVESGRADVRVFAGEVEVQTPAGTRRVKKGRALVDEAGAISITANTPADAWDRWVASRNQIETAQLASTQRYAQAPFTYGLADLAAFGYWYWIPGYGYAWQPLGVPAGWAPFFDGYWGIFPGFGWTWVSYEPWGWVPYHFGRWAFIPGFGWGWLPGYYTYWCPATVYWYQTANWIGWAPLPPKTAYGQTPSDPPRTPIVINTTTGLRKGAPNRVLEPSAGTAVTLSAFAPVTASPSQAGLTAAPSLPRVLAPVTAKPPRALPAPPAETPRRLVIKPTPPVPPRGPKSPPIRQPIIVTPKPVAPRTTIPSTAPSRGGRPSIPSPQPMPRPPRPPAPPRSNPPPHNFVAQGARPPGVVPEIVREPGVRQAPPPAMAEPRVFIEPPAPAPPPPR
jgi:ferric-dicitrate binding protein FerR (iron transport regulator)